VWGLHAGEGFVDDFENEVRGAWGEDPNVEGSNPTVPTIILIIIIGRQVVRGGFVEFITWKHIIRFLDEG
jgi:hypothetical protein